MINTSQLLAADRQAHVQARLVERGSVRSADLAGELGVSIVTVRRDLADLQRSGIAEVVYGGARLAGGRLPPRDRRERSMVEVDAKGAIARRAAELVKPGDLVFLDSGTTCAAMVPHLARLDRLTVVTSDLTTAADLATAGPRLTVIMAPGVVDGATISVVGELFPLVVAKFVFDAVFVSASAWESGVGATTGGLAYAAAKRAVVARAKRSFLLVDASKFGVSAAHMIQPLQDFDAVITDASFPADQQHALIGDGVELLIAAA